MKKLAFFSGLLSLALCGFSAPAAARDCCAYDPCEWSSCDGKFTVGADWLYWKQEQSNMEFALLTDTTGSTLELDSFRGDFIQPKHEFHNGFRVWAGYALPCNGWDVTVSYFNLPTNVKRATAIASEAQTIFVNPTLFPINDFDGFSSLALKWNTNLQNIDVDIARTICFGECFSLRPHVGFRALWMDQKYRFAADLLDSETLPIGDNFLAGRIKEKFQGYGVEGGVWAAWDFGAGFSLVGHVGGSLLYSKFCNHGDSVAFNVLGDVETTFEIASFRKDYFLGTPTMDYFVGLRYASDFCDTELSAHIGWEQHVYFDVNQLANVSGNLYTQGLTLGIGVAF